MPIPRDVCTDDHPAALRHERFPGDPVHAADDCHPHGHPRCTAARHAGAAPASGYLTGLLRQRGRSASSGRVEAIETQAVVVTMGCVQPGIAGCAQRQGLSREIRPTGAMTGHFCPADYRDVPDLSRDIPPYGW